MVFNSLEGTAVIASIISWTGTSFPIVSVQSRSDPGKAGIGDICGVPCCVVNRLCRFISANITRCGMSSLLCMPGCISPRIPTSTPLTIIDAWRPGCSVVRFEAGNVISLMFRLEIIFSTIPFMSKKSTLVSASSK